MASRATALIGAALAAVLLAAGCGDDGGGDTVPATTTAPPATTQAPPPTADAGTVTAPPPPATVTEGRPPPTATSPEDQPGGAGDEEAAVVPARLRISGTRVTPPEVAVPAFFTIRVTGVSADGEPHTIAFQGTTVDVPAGRRASFDVEGLRAGRYPVTVDGREGAATIVTGAEPGP